MKKDGYDEPDKWMKDNHDKLHDSEYKKLGFTFTENTILVRDYDNLLKIKSIVEKINQTHKFFNFLIFDIGEFRFLTSHFPIVDTQGYDKKFETQINGLKEIFELTNCDYNLHGHTHHNQMDDPRTINLSIENIDYKPIKIKDIIIKIKDKNI